MTFSVTIGGVDRTELVAEQSTRIELASGGRSRCSVQLVAEHAGAIDNVLNPKAALGRDLIVEYAEGRIFGGTVMSSSASIEGALNADVARVDVLGVGYAELADRRLISTVYETADQWAGDIAQHLLDNYLALEGVTLGNVEPGVRVERLSVSYGRISQVLDELVRLAGGAYTWRIDSHKRFYFESRGSSPGPVYVDGDVIDARLEHTREGYRNRQVVTGGTGITEERTQTFRADGTATGWAASLPIAELVEIQLGGVPVSSSDIGIKEVDLTDWVWQVGSEEFGLNSDPDVTVTPPAAGVIVTLKYHGYYPIATIRPDPAGIAERAAIEGGTGYYEAVERVESTESVEEARDLARGLLERHRTFNERLVFIVESPGWEPGQLVEFDAPELGATGFYLASSVVYETLGGELDDTVMRATVSAELAAGVPEWLEWLRGFFAGREPFRVRANQVLDVPLFFEGIVEVVGAFSSSTDKGDISSPDDDVSTWLVVDPDCILPRTVGEGIEQYSVGPVIGSPVIP